MIKQTENGLQVGLFVEQEQPREVPKVAPAKQEVPAEQTKKKTSVKK